MTDIALDEKALAEQAWRNLEVAADAKGSLECARLTLPVEKVRALVAERRRTSPSQVAPANPALVTDAMVKVALNAFDDGVGDPNDYHRRMRKALEAAFALTAAIGAGGQAVAEDIETQAWECDKWPAWLMDIVARTNDIADRLDMSSEQAHAYAVLSALSQPHPADERVVEAASAVLKWLDGGCSSWSVPQQQIRILALSAKEGR